MIGWIVFVIILAIVTFGFWVLGDFLCKKDLDGLSLLLFLLGLFGTIVTIVMIILTFTIPLSWHMKIASFNAYKQTIKSSRIQDLTALERVSIVRETAEWNEWLAESQYKRTWWINRVPKEIDNLTPIE